MSAIQAEREAAVEAKPAPGAGCACGGEGECCRGQSCALSELGHGECAVVGAAELAEGDAALLRAMGLRPEARVRVCRRGEPCIVEVGGVAGASCRIGLAKAIALRVMVRRTGPGGAAGERAPADEARGAGNRGAVQG